MPSLLSGRYSAVKVRKILYVTPRAAISNYRMTSYMEFDKGYDQSIDRI